MVPNRLRIVKFRRNDQQNFVNYNGCHGEGAILIPINTFADIQNPSRLPLFTQIVSYFFITSGKVYIFAMTWEFLYSEKKIFLRILLKLLFWANEKK